MSCSVGGVIQLGFVFFGYCWWVGGVGSVVRSIERKWRVETGEEQEGSWQADGRRRGW